MSTIGAGVIGTGQAQYLDVVLEGGPHVLVQRPSVRAERRLRPPHLRPERDPRGLGREPGRGRLRHGHADHHRPVSNRGQLGRKGCPRIGSRCSPERSAVGEDVQQHVHLADALEAEALQDRARHRAALGDQGRRAERDRLVPARPDQRSVGASAAGAFRRRAAVEQQAVLGRRGRAGADDLAVEPDRVPQRRALAEERGQEASAPRRSPPVRSRTPPTGPRRRPRAPRSSRPGAR